MQKTNPLDTHRVVFFASRAEARAKRETKHASTEMQVPVASVSGAVQREAQHKPSGGTSEARDETRITLIYNFIMLNIIIAICARIFSNSYLNVFQKILTSCEKSSVVNFYTYLGLSLLGLILCPHPIFTSDALIFILIMGLLGALGNYFIIKALSCGELSTLAPINAYKPIVALIIGIFLLGEIPGVNEILGMALILAGTYILISGKFTLSKAYLYRFLALIFSGSEAIFIKKVIIMTNILSAFLFWALAGLVFASVIAFKHPLKLRQASIKTQIALIFTVGIMQYSTNYVFFRMNTAYALSIFQLSTILSVFLGVNIFKESGLIKKLSASAIMILGALLIILSGYHPE